MNYPFKLPGHENLDLAFKPMDMMGAAQILQDGKPVKRSWGKYKVVLPGGQELVLKLKFGLDFFAPKIVFGKEIITAVPASPVYQSILTYVPLLLMLQGGAIGGLFGGLAACSCWWLFKSKLAVPLKIILSIVIWIAAMLACVIFAVMIQASLKKS